ncbi:MAG: ABC transporter permease [Pyrinomonadaceae bacterium]
MLSNYSDKKSIVSTGNKRLPALYKNSGDGFLKPKDTISIESRHFISSLNLLNLWEYRELFYFLALRDIKIRYKQTLIGIAWVLLQPIITTVIFTTIAFKLGTGQDPKVPYPLFAFSGLMLWIFINSAISNCSNSLINHSGLITKVYFPRLIIPLSAVGATLVDLFFGFVSLLIAMLLYGVTPSWKNLLILPLMIPTLLLTLGLGILTAALNVKYRDVKYILPFILQVFFFISPIFYSLSIIPAESLWLWKLNPLTGLMENFRALLFNQNIDWSSLSISIVISLLLFLLSVFVFHRMEDDFADVI